MSMIKWAIIRAIPPEGGTRFLFRRNIAGLPVFKRMILTLQRAGIEHFIVLAQGISESDRQWVESDLESDFRFKGHLRWFDLDNELSEVWLNSIEPLSDLENVLVVEGNLVTTAELIKDFITSVSNSRCLHQGEIAGLLPDADHSSALHILPSSDTHRLEHYLRHGTFDGPVSPVTLSGSRFFWQTVKDAVSAKSAERRLLNEYKLHYTQAMDIWFNSLFSLRISSLLVKTPLTPNQLTLFGLIIGLVAGLLFARGDYWSGLMGGFLLAATAVWDCCDGDVARLKFMESDFGEQLDTICDNIINVFIFTGMMIGMAHSQGLAQAIVPFLLLALGGGLIFIFIYFPEGGKGSFFRGTWLYEVIQVLASRNFIYIVVLFAIAGKLDWFLWLAGLGSNVFALSLYLAKRKIIYSTPNGGRD